MESMDRGGFKNRNFKNVFNIPSQPTLLSRWFSGLKNPFGGICDPFLEGYKLNVIGMFLGTGFSHTSSRPFGLWKPFGYVDG